MSVLVEAIGVIVRIATVGDKYAGGLDAYRAACPKRTFCVDNHLTRVGFMASADVEWCVEGLERAGLTDVRDGKAVDTRDARQRAELHEQSVVVAGAGGGAVGQQIHAKRERSGCLEPRIDCDALLQATKHQLRRRYTAL